MAPRIDPDWEMLDSVIGLGDDIVNQQNEIKQISDEPPVLRLALYSEGAALLIKKLAADWRPRLRRLKALADEATSLKEENGRLKARLLELEQAVVGIKK